MPTNRRTRARSSTKPTSALVISSPTRRTAKHARRTSPSGSVAAGSCTRRNGKASTESWKRPSRSTCVECEDESFDCELRNRTNGNDRKTSVTIDRSASGRGGSAPAVAVQGRSFLVTKRSRLTSFVGVLPLISALAFLAGCGGGGNKSSSGDNSNAGSNSNSGKTYPVLRVVWDAPDYMDLQLYYTVAAYQIAHYVCSGLLGYKHAAGPEGAQLVPYLAESMPTISADGKDLKFKLRANLKDSNGQP